MYIFDESKVVPLGICKDPEMGAVLADTGEAASAFTYSIQ